MECEYCKNVEKISYGMKIHGEYFKLHKTAGYKDEYIKYSSWVMKGKSDEKAGIFIAENGGNGVYFDINYCPICGRKV